MRTLSAAELLFDIIEQQRKVSTIDLFRFLVFLVIADYYTYSNLRRYSNMQFRQPLEVWRGIVIMRDKKTRRT